MGRFIEDGSWIGIGNEGDVLVRGATQFPGTVVEGGPIEAVSLLTLGAGFVPTFIADGETFAVPANRQALFAVPIDNEGTIDITGVLIEVD